MRILSILRTATLALSLVAVTGAMGTAFAASRVQQQEAADSYTGISSNFHFHK